MELKKRLTMDLITLSLVFLAIILFVSVLFINFNNSLNSLINESEPIDDAFKHMIKSIYQDNLLLHEYLTFRDYSGAIEHEKLIEESSILCKKLEDKIQEMIDNNVITDESLINKYDDARQSYFQVEEIKEELILLHRRELTTGEDFTKEKQNLLEEHSVLLKKSLEKFNVSLDNIDERNRTLRNNLLARFKLYVFFLFASLVLFFGVLFYKARKISNQVIYPINEIIGAIDEFVDGDYNKKIKPTGEISEISDLQKNMNNIFRVIKKSIEKNPLEKEKVESLLLKEDYIKIINFLKQNHLQKKKATITNLRKYLNITHPTIISRINFLKDKKYLSVNKEGREKYLILTQKGLKF